MCEHWTAPIGINRKKLKNSLNQAFSLKVNYYTNRFKSLWVLRQSFKECIHIINYTSSAMHLNTIVEYVLI